MRPKSVAHSSVLPNFVVIGAMRSGSTSLYKYLQAHPDVYMPRKEIHFFDRKWDRGLSWYLTRFEGHSGQTAVGEATPTYLAEPEALDRMASTIPDARLLAVLRDPVDRAYSHYWMEHARARDPRTFEEAIADELAERPGAPDYLARGGMSASSRTSAHGSPRAAVARRPVRRPARSPAGDLCRRVRVPRDRRPVRPAAARGAGQPLRRVPVVRLRRVRRQLPSTWGIGRIVGRLNAREGPYPPMAPETRADLRRHFAPEIAALATWLGRDLSQWA